MTTNKTNQEYEAAKSRISTLIAEIGEQLKAIFFNHGPESGLIPAKSNQVNPLEGYVT